MKSLVLKDLYVLSKQMKLFLLMALIFAALPSLNMNAFAVVYAAMLPYTAVAYDERAKWDQMAAMLPYSNAQIVLAKYVLGYVCILAVALVSLMVKLALPFFGALLTDTPNTPYSLVPLICVGMLLLALTLPFMLRFGVEKGRMIFIFVMVAVAVGAAGFVGNLDVAWEIPSGVFALLPVVTVAANALSILLSIRLYPRRSC